MVFEKEEPTMERKNQNKENSIDEGQNMERKNGNKEKRTHNKDDPKWSKKEENVDREDAHDMIVTLAPMEIRAFILEVMYE